MLSYGTLFDPNEQIEDNEELWEGADKTSLLPPELELESRILETKDYDVIEAKKITDKYFSLKNELKENKNEFMECENIYDNYLKKKKELSTAILNLSNSISNLETFLGAIDLKNMFNNAPISKKVEIKDDSMFKHTQEYINYLQNIDKKINNADYYFLEKMNQENSRLNKNCNEIQDKMRIIRNMIMISIKESLNEDDAKQLKLDSKICPICFENEVSYCFNPCGHLICFTCSDNIRTNKCPTCRQQYTSKIKIYFNI